MAIGEIPTHHLEECFTRALRNKQDDFPLSGTAVNRAYQEMKPELLRQAQDNAAQQDRLLMSGHGSLDRMSIDEWKTRHNLPATWKLGDPYPPESDLHGKPVPPPIVQVDPCKRCDGAGWTRIPYDAVNKYPPKLIRCKCQEEGANP